MDHRNIGEASPQDFATILQDAMRAGGLAPADQAPDASPLACALEKVRLALPMADNMGRSGDDLDLYVLIDELAAGARAAYPETLCRPGCGGCCHYPAALFTASRQEWEPLREHVARTWPAERLVRFVERFWSTHGRYMNRLRAVEWLMEFPLPVTARPEAVPLACPFLEDDRCSVYAVRPTYCRCFGHFSFKYWFRREAGVYACDTQMEHLEPITRRPGRARLPSFNPVFDRRYVLSRGGRRRLLAIWVARTWPKRWLGPARNQP